MTIFNIVRAFQNAEKKGYEQVYIMCDLHNTIIPASNDKNHSNRAFYSLAKEVLQNMTKNPRIVMILWTSTFPAHLKSVLEWLKENGIEFKYVNENPDFKSTEINDYSVKPAFDVLLDNCAGFAGENDWYWVKNELIKAGEWLYPSRTEIKMTESTKI